jgi:hypothetical protein
MPSQDNITAPMEGALTSGGTPAKLEGGEGSDPAALQGLLTPSW